ncbi:MAG: DoxX family protein [Duncaniella sp.]|nr:DoxX family protein [Duncaniella sp.]
MPSSQSSSSQRQSLIERILGSTVLIWLMRLAVGGLFAFSGFVKAVDPWGSIIKINEYLTVWGTELPGALTVCGGFLLGGFEFLWGVLLMLGCYRRCSVWMLTLQMTFMLPLTLYILIASPVDDCGCFGDAITISNTATFVKNIVITIALIYLILYNTRVAGLFTTYVQWIVGGLVTFYIFAVELFSYNIQPLQDYRRFAPGAMLVEQEADDDAADVEMEYIYEKDGQRRTFAIDNLPDSTWTFVDRKIVSGEADNTDGFIIIRDGEDIAPELIDNEIPMFLVSLPNVRMVDLSATYVINELNDFILSQGGSMLALVGSDEASIEWWRDISMATYPIVKADERELLELARGNAALIYLNKGRVEWKRSVESITGTVVRETPSDKLLAELDPEPDFVLKSLTFGFGAVFLIFFILDRSGKLIQWHFSRKKRKQKVLQSKT